MASRGGTDNRSTAASSTPWWSDVGSWRSWWDWSCGHEWRPDVRQHNSWWDGPEDDPSPWGWAYGWKQTDHDQPAASAQGNPPPWGYWSIVTYHDRPAAPAEGNPGSSTNNSCSTGSTSDPHCPMPNRPLPPISEMHEVRPQDEILSEDWAEESPLLQPRDEMIKM